MPLPGSRRPSSSGRGECGRAPDRGGLRSARRIVRSVCFVVALHALGGCAEPIDPEPSPEVQLGGPWTFFADDEGVFARPREIALDRDGRVYVLDRSDRRVVVIDRDGAVVRTIGAPGEGPGELADPMFLDVGDEGRVRVFDLGRGALTDYAPEGGVLEERRIELQGPPTYLSFGPDGLIAYWSIVVPAQGGLVALHDPGRGESSFIGAVVSDEPLDQGTFLSQLHARELPGFLRNAAVPVMHPDGSLWVILQTEGVLARYARDGTERSRTRVRLPAMPLVEEEYFRWYATVESPQVLRFLNHVEAAIMVRDRLWVLWNVPTGHQRLVTIHDDAGVVAVRLLFDRAVHEDEDVAPGVRRIRFAVDADRMRMYVLDQEALGITAYDLPEAAFAP